MGHLHWATCIIQPRAFHQERSRALGHTQCCGLGRRHLVGAELTHHAAVVPFSCAALPCCHQHRWPAVRVQQFFPHPVQPHSWVNAQSCPQCGRRPHRAALHIAHPVRPRGVRIGESAHGRRVGHCQPGAGPAVQETLAAEECDGALRYTPVHSVFGG